MTANGILDDLTAGQTFLIEATRRDGALDYRVRLLAVLPECERRRAAQAGHALPAGFTVWCPMTEFTGPETDDAGIEAAAVERLTQLRRAGHLMPGCSEILPLDYIMRLPDGEVRRHRPGDA